MATLLLMRHAKSSWDEAGGSDHDRPLNERGRRAAPRMGRLLRERDLVPDLVVTSSALRALETAHAVVASAGYEGRIEVTRRLYLAPPEGYLEQLEELARGARRVLMIGHNPGIAELVTLLTGAAEPMPTGAIAQIELAGGGQWTAPGGATLQRVFRPRELDD